VADRIEASFLGLVSAIVAGLLIYALATGEIHGPGYAAFAAFESFFAVVFAVRLALLARLPLGGERQ